MPPFDYDGARRTMIERQIAGRGITDERVLEAFQRVPRHTFVPENLRDRAYEDCPLPIGPGQTISQPYIIALMLAALEIDGPHKVLEIGTGSGFQTALLSELAAEVYSIEIDPALSARSEVLLESLGYKNVQLRAGNGFDGWPEAGPFDAIVVSAAPAEIPRELVRELRVGGRMVLPLGTDDQELVLLKKTDQGLESEDLGGVAFVQMRTR